MKRLVTILAGFLTLGGASGSERLLHELQPIEWQSIVCGCSFNESIADATEGSYGSGPEILVLDPNGDPPNARVNLGAGNVRLQPKTPLELPLYSCQAGNVWSSSWQSGQVTLQVELVATSPGAEACWFSGTVAATAGAADPPVAIRGGCGC